jgi:hypothetical protein
MSSGQNVFAAVLDQKQESLFSSSQILAFDPIGQEFKPSLPILEAVEVRVSSPVPAGDDTITLTVREDTITGTVIATASQFLVQGFEGWVYFTLTPVSVTPDSTYVIRLEATKTTFLWDYGVGNPYPRGVAIESGNPISGQDFTFRTYGSTYTPPIGAPVGGFIEPVNKVAVFAPYLALLGVIGAVAVIYWKRPDN